MSHSHDQRQYDHYIKTDYDGNLRESNDTAILSLLKWESTDEDTPERFTFLNTVTAGAFNQISPQWTTGNGEANVSIFDSKGCDRRIEEVSFPFYLFNQADSRHSWFSWMNGLAVKIMKDYYTAPLKCCRFEDSQLAVEVNDDGVYYFWNRSIIKT